MGLDLLVEGCAKPGHEAEWRGLAERAFDSDIDDEQTARFQAISIPPFERLNAPRVGQDEAANAWIFEKRKAESEDERAAALSEFDGYYVVALVECDGVPKYSHGGLGGGVDETSFRGKFLELCGDVLDKRTLEAAWEHMMPEAAVAYGQTLLAAADRAAERGPVEEPPRKRGFLAALGFGRKKTGDMTLGEQLDVVRACGRWYVFWGERGHPIRAWY